MIPIISLEDLLKLPPKPYRLNIDPESRKKYGLPPTTRFLDALPPEIKAALGETKFRWVRHPYVVAMSDNEQQFLVNIPTHMLGEGAEEQENRIKQLGEGGALYTIERHTFEGEECLMVLADVEKLETVRIELVREHWADHVMRYHTPTTGH